MTIALVKKHATRIANGKARVQPGQPLSIHEGVSIGDGIWQGDLGIEVIDAIPPGHVQAVPCTQLVPGNTIGSRHTLKDTSTVDQFHLPSDWTDEPDHDGLWGPVFRAKEETTIEHPTHGDVTIAAGHLIRCRYQRNWDAQQRRERRSID